MKKYTYYYYIKSYFILVKIKNPDFICLQETKLQDLHIEEIEIKLKELVNRDMKIYWNSSRARKGYSGTGKIISITKIDYVVFKMIL